MNKQITRLTLDVGLRDSYKVVFAKMGDTERRVIAEIKDNGEDYSLAGVNTVEVRCRKADGKQVTKNATKDNNTIVIDISGQMTTCKGTAIVDVVLYGTDGGVLSTAKFYLNVDDGAVNEDDIKSSNEYESLTDALRTVGLAKEVANTALNTANEAVKTAESAMKQIPGYTSRAETAASKAEENKTAAALGTELGISQGYLSQLVKKETGKTYSELIQQKKLEKAKELLKYSEKTVGQIAEETGYSDYYYFTKIFKRLTNLSPTEYRKQEKK